MSSWMYSSSSKRRRQSLSPPAAGTGDASGAEPDSQLHVVSAHEAALVHGHDNLAAQTEHPDVANTRLVRWTGSIRNDDAPVWLDKYDALNLIERLPSPQAPPSPTLSIGFSDLPSDSEELFYFDEATRQDIAQGKKRRKLEIGREQRMRELDQQQQQHEATQSGQNDDEIEPPPKQLEMMRKLHQTLSSSAEPALLEMRIMANYASDPRFSFLRKNGRYRAQWEEMRANKTTTESANRAAPSTTLVGYASDSDDEQGTEEGVGVGSATDGDLPAPADESRLSTSTQEASDDLQRLKQEQRAAKAKAWAEKRRLGRAEASNS
ncbi:hypothetical protein ACM66B_000491 [Microbotryomycetes sp. NB124-2]